MTILIVEDNLKLAANLQRLLELEGHAVAVANDGEEGLRRALAERFDCILLDLNLPKLDGIGVCRALRAGDDPTPVPILMLTARSSKRDVVLGLDTGADDYLAKPFDLDELEARVRALARRAGGDSPAPAFGGLQVDAESGAVLRDGQPMELTQREAALLRALLARPGQAVAKERLLELVFPGDLDVQPEAVEVVAYRLRKKLSPSPVQLVTLRGLGYLLKASV
jgi:two-component system response regulator TctD